MILLEIIEILGAMIIIASLMVLLLAIVVSEASQIEEATGTGTVGSKS